MWLIDWRQRSDGFIQESRLQNWVPAKTSQSTGQASLLIRRPHSHLPLCQPQTKAGGRKVTYALSGRPSSAPRGPECCPWVPLFCAFPLSNDSWQILERKQHPSILSTILYRVLIKQYLQTYLCDVMLGSSATFHEHRIQYK